MRYYKNLYDTIESEYTCLIAGTIGSGKSVLLDDLIFNLCIEDVEIGIIDLKRVQYNKWAKMPRLQQLGIAKTVDEAIDLIDWLNYIMECRYERLEKSGKVKSTEKKIVLIIDELADLMTHKGVETKLTHLMRLCRAANISVFMATQSPSRKVIPPNIQNCVTSALGLRCRSAVESRQIIGISGCEHLPKYGTGIFWNSDGYTELGIPYTPDEWIAEQIEELIKILNDRHVSCVH